MRDYKIGSIEAIEQEYARWWDRKVWREIDRRSLLLVTIGLIFLSACIWHGWDWVFGAR